MHFDLCNEIKAIVKSKVQVAIVVGGGNFGDFVIIKKSKFLELIQIRLA